MYRLLQLSCLCVFLISGLQAQPYQGQVAVTGYFSVTHKKDNNTSFRDFRTTAIRFSPNLNWMLTDRTAIQLGIEFGYTESTAPNNGNRDNLITTNTLGGRVSTQHFFAWGEGVGFYLQPYVSYTTTTGENFFVLTSNIISFGPFTEQSLSGGITPGIYYFLSDRFGLEASMGSLQYQYTSAKMEHEFVEAFSVRRSSVRLVGGTRFALGIRYTLGKRKA